MGCSSSHQVVATPAVRVHKQNDDDLEEMSWPVLLCGKQGGVVVDAMTTSGSAVTITPKSSNSCRSSSKSSVQSGDSKRTPLYSSESRSPSQSSDPVPTIAEDTPDLGDSMEIEWLELLCGGEERVSVSRGKPPAVKSTNLRTASMTSSEGATRRPSTATTISTGNMSRTSSNEQASRKPFMRSRATVFSRLSSTSDHSLSVRFDMLEMDELRYIQVEILSGILIALADSGNARFGEGALPCNPKVALMHCQQAINAGRAKVANVVLALTDLVVSLKAALVDAGVDRIKADHLCMLLGMIDTEQIRSPVSGEIFVNEIEVSELVNYSMNSFLEQKWNEFGYGAGRLAWDLVKHAHRTKESVQSTRHFALI